MTNSPPIYPWRHLWQKLDAEMHLSSLDHKYAHVELLSMITTPPHKVLDVGCFCGGSGRWLKQKFPDTHVTGIEMLPTPAAMAKEIYNEVLVGKLEDIDLGSWQGRFDAIIVADVLEHIYNPWAALQRLKPLIAPKGAIYISLPNIRNLNILIGLTKGEWRYAESGILDITHIRFFTKAQALEMLHQTGWKVEEIRHNPDQRLTKNFEGMDINKITNFNAGNLKLDNLSQNDVVEMLTLQFLIRATPM